MPNIYFITGTDTDVGKTVFSMLFYLKLKKDGRNPFLFKPAESGLGQGEGDASKYLSIMPKDTKLCDIVGYQFNTPLAPLAASKIENNSINYSAITSRIETLSKSYSDIIVEGAGGLLVPITNDKNYLDLAKDLNAKCIVVVASRLGCINHTLLTLDCLKNADVKTLGYVFNDLNKETEDAYQQAAMHSNRKYLAKATKAYGVINEISYLPKLAEPISEEALEYVSISI